MTASGVFGLVIFAVIIFAAWRYIKPKSEKVVTGSGGPGGKSGADKK